MNGDECIAITFTSGLGKVSGFFWRNPGLGLFLLLLGPLMWFGIVYFGSLLTLLWQGFLYL